MKNETARPLCAIFLFLILFLTSSPITQQYSFAQEDDTEYGSQSDDEQQAEEESHDEEQTEASNDYYYYEEDGSGPVESTPFDDYVTLSEQEIITVNVLANDRAVLAPRSPSLVEVAEPGFGHITANSDNTITYAPDQMPLPSGYDKLDVVQYTATDGKSKYTGTITFRVQQVNDPPIAYSANYAIKENQQSTFYLGAFDEDNDALTFTVLSNATFGKSQVDRYSGRLIYTPLQGYSGTDTLRFQVSDGLSESGPASIVISVLGLGGVNSARDNSVFDDSNSSSDEPDDEGALTSENIAPVAHAGDDFDSVSGGLVLLDAGESYDADGDSLTYAWSQLSGPAVLLLGNDTVSPEFDAPSIELDTELIFELKVSDGNLTNTAMVAVTVKPISIDIIPNTYPNVIKLGEPDVEVPVAIIGNSALDASSNIDEESLRFGPNLAPSTSYELSDFNGDGFTDHISYYRTGDLGLEPGDKKACLSGNIETESGSVIEFNICKNIKVTG